MSDFMVKALDESTWPDFARLVEKNNGVWGGCWCMSFHQEGVGRNKSASQNRSEKEDRVREYRHKGIASVALEGALNEITRLGGGTVESYPQEVEGQPISGSFLYNGTISIFERHGFQRTRKLGKNHWVVTKVVDSLS